MASIEFSGVGASRGPPEVDSSKQEELERQRRHQAEVQAKKEDLELQRRHEAEVQAKQEELERQRRYQAEVQAKKEDLERQRRYQAEVQAKQEELERQRRHEAEVLAKQEELERQRRHQAEVQAKEEELERQRRHQADLERQRRYQVFLFFVLEIVYLHHHRRSFSKTLIRKWLQFLRITNYGVLEPDFFCGFGNFVFKLRIVLGIDQAEVEHQLVELLRPYRCGVELATVSPG